MKVIPVLSSIANPQPSQIILLINLILLDSVVRQELWEYLKLKFRCKRGRMPVIGISGLITR